MPKSILGKWSVALIVSMFVLFFFGSSTTEWLYSSVPAGNSLANDISGRPFLALSMLAGIVSGISAFVTGLIAIRKHNERTVLTYFSTAIGLLLLLFIMGELITPH